MYSVATISKIIKGRLTSKADIEIAHLVYDSRRLQQPQTSLFFALKTSHADGHNFILDAYKKGVRTFVVSQPVDLTDAAVILVDDTLVALQHLAAHHRRQFHIPVIGITGSNGKTVVKEWLNILLEERYQVARSPKSFNSQIGVPLSVWDMEEDHTLGIFEAGISKAGEMKTLREIIQPTIGILTNIGEAHSEGFASAEEKLKEKLALFSAAKIVIGPRELLHQLSVPTFTWSFNEEADLRIVAVAKQEGQSFLTAVYRDKEIQLAVSFTDEASIQNAVTCWCVLLHLNFDDAEIQTRFGLLHSVDMRLQLIHAINNCLLINDSYSADPTSLKIALDFLEQQSAGLNRTIILSDFFESGKTGEELHHEIEQLITAAKIQKLVAIGEKIGGSLKKYLPSSIEVHTHLTTAEFINSFRSSSFHNEVILLKGARRFNFERIAALFEEKLHGTVLQINLTALVHNLKEYQKKLEPSTRIMAMVKAFSYGSGGAEIASVLQFHNVAYLGVAYADEGIELVRSGIALPVMVMNAEQNSFAAIVEHDLQPVLYSLEIFHKFEAYIKDQGLLHYPVHLEIESGMNRLGFTIEAVREAAGYLSGRNYLSVQSVFSHLAGSEDPAQDDFTTAQVEKFEEAVAILQRHLTYPFLKHISNSAAIVRHPHLQMDMVRVGIGLYGVEPDAENELNLLPVATLRSTIAQIKELQAGESVSYNRRGVVQRPSRIATVRIGYADGYSRRFGNGVGKMLIHERLVPVIGTVCMDMTMVDITDIPNVKEGEDVIVFGGEPTVQDLANWMGTIPYEIMTSVSQRVKRVYYYE